MDIGIEISRYRSIYICILIYIYIYIYICIYTDSSTYHNRHGAPAHIAQTQHVYICMDIGVEISRYRSIHISTYINIYLYRHIVALTSIVTAAQRMLRRQST